MGYDSSPERSRLNRGGRAFAKWTLLAVLGMGCDSQAVDLGEKGAGGGQRERDSEVIVTIPAQAFALAADAERLYWIERNATSVVGRAMSCMKRACSSTLLEYGEAGYESWLRLAIVAGQIYWPGISPSGVWSLVTCPVTGCAGAPRLLAEDVWEIAVDEEAVYYLHISDLAAAELEILRLAHGSEPGGATLVTKARDAAGLMVVHGFAIYWAQRLQEGEPATIQRVPKLGGDPETVVDQQPNPTPLVSDGHAIYWTNQNLAGWIASIPPPGDQPGQLAYTRIYDPVTLPYSLVADRDELYWIQESALGKQDLVRFVPGTSAEPELILSGVVNSDAALSAVAIDSEAVYVLKSRTEEASEGRDSVEVTDILRVVR